MSRIISIEQLKQGMMSLLRAGKKVAAPVAIPDKGLYFFEYVKSEDAISDEFVKTAFDADIHTTNTVKEFVFPRHEILFRYKRDGKEVSVEDAAPFSTPQFLFGVRPCQAAALPILDPLFAWDYQDRFYQSRRKMTTVISVACGSKDEHCFCSSVGLAPDSTEGSDVLLFDLKDGTFEVRILTEKGEQLFSSDEFKNSLSDSDKTGSAIAPPDIAFDAKKVEKWIDGHFEDPIWDRETTRCVGCGACTYVCPTCHCFDIVDEGNVLHGVRVKNWDSCQAANFTLHASGHNPRAVQGQRQRQRITHKFSIYPQKFGKILCTGCGNCTRECSESLGVRPILSIIDKQNCIDK